MTNQNNAEKIDKQEFFNGVIDELSEGEHTDYYRGRVFVKAILLLNDYNIE